MYLITGLNTGGAEMMLLRLLERLDRDRYEPHVVSLLPPGGVGREIEARGLPVHSLHMSGKLDFGVFFRLRKLLGEIGPHILHTQLFHADIVGRLVGRWVRVPVVVSSIRNTIIGGRMREKLLGWTDGLAQKTTIVSHSSAQRMIGVGAVSESKLTVVYNGLDVQQFNAPGEKRHLRQKLQQEEGLPADIPLVLAVGRLYKQKGFSNLVEAVSMLEGREIPFHVAVAGAGPLRGELEERIKALGCEHRVHLLGLRDDIPRLMASADLLVQSSLWEGLPGVVLEAMASGLPVVATDVGGTGEAVRHGETGLLVPPGDSHALAEAVEDVLEKPEEERQEMGRWGRRVIDGHFSLESMVAEYEAIYEQCLRERGWRHRACHRDGNRGVCS